MIRYIRSLYPSQVIILSIKTRQPARMVVEVRHERKPNTVYFKSTPIVGDPNTGQGGQCKYSIKIPKSPQGLILEVYNAAHGNVPDSSFKVKMDIEKLTPSLAIDGIMDRSAHSFAAFSDWFAENAGVLPAQNHIYLSPDKKFRIDYKDVIRDDHGRELTTPARINSKSGLIEISRKYYLLFTVPGRKAINWHEYSHVYENQNPSNEFEADENAIMFYLSTGNPKLEAFHVFLKTFSNTPSDLNTRRFHRLDNYIREFEHIQEKLAA